MWEVWTFLLFSCLLAFGVHFCSLLVLQLWLRRKDICLQFLVLLDLSCAIVLSNRHLCISCQMVDEVSRRIQLHWPLMWYSSKSCVDSTIFLPMKIVHQPGHRIIKLFAFDTSSYYYLLLFCKALWICLWWYEDVYMYIKIIIIYFSILTCCWWFQMNGRRGNPLHNEIVTYLFHKRQTWALLFEMVSMREREGWKERRGTVFLISHHLQTICCI